LRRYRIGKAGRLGQKIPQSADQRKELGRYARLNATHVTNLLWLVLGFPLLFLTPLCDIEQQVKNNPTQPLVSHVDLHDLLQGIQQKLPFNGVPNTSDHTPYRLTYFEKVARFKVL
jgi:hypothetical protein